MRLRSKKTAAVYREWSPFRAAFLEECPVCCACGCRADCVDEICRGSHRMTAFVERSAWLPACGLCNTGQLADSTEWPLARKVAAKLLTDPEHFDLAAINRIRGRAPNALGAEEVLDFVQAILMDRRNALVFDL